MASRCQVATVDGFNRERTTLSGQQSHARIEKDEQIVDITANEFDGVDDPVLVTDEKNWHLQIVEENRHVARIVIYCDEHTRDKLWGVYELILLSVKF
jgi:hypothetical protein